MLDTGQAANRSKIDEQGASCLRDKIQRALSPAAIGTAATLPDRRKAPGVRVRKRARVYRNSADQGIDCIVRYLAVNGAQIEFEVTPELSADVMLYLVAENAHIPAHVAWQNGQQVGLRFCERLGWLVRNNLA